MLRHHLTFRSLAGTLALSAGLATPMALGADKGEDPKPPEKQSTVGDPPLRAAPSTAAARTQEGDDDAPNFVEVRVSLPDGRSFMRLEPRRSFSARYAPRRGASSSAAASKSRSGTVHIRGGSHAASGGGGGSSSTIGARASSSGGGGGSSVASGGGGGGGGGVAAATPSAGEAGMSAERGVVSGGVFSYGNASGNHAAQNAAQSDIKRGVDRSSAMNKRVPTIGGPTFDRQGNATGGQRVEFHDAGMSAAVVGNRVYFTGVELVIADQPFEIITGTRVGADGVISQDGRLSSDGVEKLSSFNTGSSAIKLEFESGTVVTLTLYSPSSDPQSPDRVQRTWTVRIR